MTNTLTKFLSEASNFAYINNSKDSAEREKRLLELKTKFLAVGNASGNFSSVNFSANPYIEDSGNPTADESGIYDNCQTFAEYNTKAREQVAFGRIKSLVANSNVQKSLKEWILKKNNISKRNRAAKLEAQKSFGNR